MPTRTRVVLILTVVAIFVFLSSLRGLAGVYTDYLWFDQLGFASAWRGVLGAKFVLGAIFTVAMFLIVWVNLVIAGRLAPSAAGPATTPEDLIVERYQAVLDKRMPLARVLIAALLGLLSGPAMAGQWNDWVLFTNSQSFGLKDPLFNKDVGFYVFRLPFLTATASWLFTALLLSVVITAAAHYLNGGIRVQPPTAHVTNAVKAHLSVLLGLLALVRAAGYYLSRFELNFSRRGFVHGANFTDVKAQLPALNLLVIISIAAFVLFIINIRLRGFALPLIAVGLWAFVSIVVASIYPRIIQSFTVNPAESVKERTYIGRNIEFTRRAYNIDTVDKQAFPYTNDLTVKELEENIETVANIRLWDPHPSITEQSFKRLQEFRTFFRIEDVDVDRYTIDGKRVPVVIAARELNQTGLNKPSWVSRHLQYTHGYGVVVAPVNVVDPSGQPSFAVKDLPLQGKLSIKQPRIYFGASNAGFSIVRTKTPEVDYVRDDNKLEEHTYAGKGGVAMGSLPRRFAFFLRFGDINTLISNLVQKNSRIIYVRNVRERAEMAAPFLRYDSDPYPVVWNDRIVWVLDAYTTSTRFPYSQGQDFNDLPLGNGLTTSLNYVRNAVKVVIDAYDGTTSFFIVDSKDPIAQAYRQAFPKLFRSNADLDRLYPNLRDHFRYPEDLFEVQARRFALYHVTEPSQFYNRSDAWDLSQDPGVGSPSLRRESTTVIDPVSRTSSVRENRMDPYYLMMRLPGEKESNFLMLQNFVPFSKNDQQRNLVAFMIAKSDPKEYGKLEAFVMPARLIVSGPTLVVSQIDNDPPVSQQVTLLDQKGSQVLWGSVQVIPLGNSLLFVRPLYVQADNVKLPELKRIVMLQGDRVAIDESFNGALAKLFGSVPAGLPATREFERAGTTATTTPATGATPTTQPGGTATTRPSTVPVDATVAQLVDQAAATYEKAQAALKDGNLGEYQARMDEVGLLIQAVQARQPGATINAAVTPATVPPTAPATTSAPATTVGR